MYRRMTGGRRLPDLYPGKGDRSRRDRLTETEAEILEQEEIREEAPDEIPREVRTVIYEEYLTGI